MAHKSVLLNETVDALNLRPGMTVVDGTLGGGGHSLEILKRISPGGRLIGICGGYQMLGRQLHDPLGLEGAPGSAPGLGLLDCVTTFAADEITHQVTAACDSLPFLDSNVVVLTKVRNESLSDDVDRREALRVSIHRVGIVRR